MGAKKFVTAFAVNLLATTAVQAEIIPGRWELVDRLEPDTPIIIKLKAGERMECSFKRSNPEEVIFIDDVGTERSIPKNEILRIESSEKTGDSLKNGAGYGAVIGAAGAVVGLLAYAHSVTDSGPVVGSESAGYFFAAGLAGAGIGALTGIGIDASFKGRKVLFKAR